METRIWVAQKDRIDRWAEDWLLGTDLAVKVMVLKSGQCSPFNCDLQAGARAVNAYLLEELSSIP